MKAYVILFFSIIAMSMGCKKYDNNGNKPATEKKVVVTTVAGNGEPTFVNDPVLSATFDSPEDIAIAADGTIYVTDALNFCTRKIGGGKVLTFAGGSGFGIRNGNETTTQFKNPYSIALDANGNLYNTDENDPRIRKISPDGNVSTYAGIETPGLAD